MPRKNDRRPSRRPSLPGTPGYQTSARIEADHVTRTPDTGEAGRPGRDAPIPTQPPNRVDGQPTGRPSDETLGADLDEVGMHDLAARARAGEFNDYFGSHTMPQTALLALVRTDSRGTPEQRATIMSNIVNGKYDGTQAESDEWARSDEGRELFSALLATAGKPGGVDVDTAEAVRRKVFGDDGGAQ